MYAYGPGDDIGGIYTPGIGQGSTDGNGWIGNGKHSIGPLGGRDDDGRIAVALVNGFTDLDPMFMFFSF